MNGPEKTRRALTALLLLAIAVTAWLMLYQAHRFARGESHHDVIFNPGFQHSQRLKVAAARAAMDVLGMTTVRQDSTTTASYQADYHLQRTQIKADSLGLERWAAQDSRRQGLLLEVRASLVDLNLALDQAADSAVNAGGQTAIPLLPALNRTESALSNYAASLAEPTHPPATNYLFASPVLLWWLLILLLLELTMLAWLVFLPNRS